MIDSEELKWVLHKHGWLKVGQLAVLLRGNNAPADIRAIQRLIQANEKALSTVKGPDGKRLIALKENRGALKKLGQYAHKCLCTDIAIDAERGGWRGKVWTEQDIQKGLLFKGPILGKVPDLAYMSDWDTLVWVEVEHSKRNTKSMDELVNWIIRVTAAPAPGLYPELEQGWYLERIRFYCNSEFEKRLRNEIEKRFEYVGVDKAWDFIDDNIDFWTVYGVGEELRDMPAYS